MDDYYIYYEPKERDPLCGTIKAISPTVQPEMGSTEFIRVSSEVGLSFMVGTARLNQYVVAWNSDSQQMQLTIEAESLVRERPIAFLTEIPTAQDEICMVVTWRLNSKVFNVTTTGVPKSYPNMKVNFFVTRLHDPNIPYYNFQTMLHNTMNDTGVNFDCDVELPETFSVYTKQQLGRYELRIMK